MRSIEELGELVCYEVSTPQQALLRVADADVIITNKVVIDEKIISAAPRLKLICEAATGMNNIDLEAARRHSVSVRNVAGYSTSSVVQLTFAMILNLLCRTQQYSEWVKSGQYSRSPIFTNTDSPFEELDSKTIGIVGMGTIGRKVAEVAGAFGMRVIYYSTSGTSHCTTYPSVSLDDLLKESDIVSIHAPLNERTKGLIGPGELKKMKRTAILINIGRGGIVDEKALADALDEQRLAGAGLDVFASEPLASDNPLLHTKHPERLTLTPHIGWASAEAIDRLVEGIASNIRSELH